MAVVPPQLSDSEGYRWADEMITGNDRSLITETQTPNSWLTSLKGQVFDPPSVNEILMELVAGAYGEIPRVKGIIEMPDGKGFYIDFVQGMSDMGYVEIKIPRWLKDRPIDRAALKWWAGAYTLLSRTKHLSKETRVDYSFNLSKGRARLLMMAFITLSLGVCFLLSRERQRRVV